MLKVKPVALTVNTPVVPVPGILVTFAPLMAGLALSEVLDTTTPRSVMVALLSEATSPPSTAEVEVIEALVGVPKLTVTLPEFATVSVGLEVNCST